jgi:hypothetical protein
MTIDMRVLRTVGAGITGFVLIFVVSAVLGGVVAHLTGADAESLGRVAGRLILLPAVIGAVVLGRRSWRKTAPLPQQWPLG